MSWASMITEINAGSAAGNRYNVQGTITRTTTTDTITGDGTSTSPVIIRGYATTIGDGYQGRTNSNGALITTHMPNVSYTTGRLDAAGAGWCLWESLNITGATNNHLFTAGENSVIARCCIANASTDANARGIYIFNGVVQIADNDIAAGGPYVLRSASNMTIVGNRIAGGSTAAIELANVSGVRLYTIVGNVIYASSGIGIAKATAAGYLVAIGNTIVGNTGSGININTGSTVLDVVVGNMITDNGGYGIDGVSAANAVFAAYNRTRDNTSGALNLATDWLAATTYSHVTTDTGGQATDYVNAGANDYTLISSSPAKGVGLFAHRDIGAVQHADASGLAVCPLGGFVQ